MKRSSIIEKFFTAEEYLLKEKRSSTRHEFVAGQIYAMAGGSLRHNDIAVGLAAILRQKGKGKQCKAYVSDVKVYESTADIERYYYPDVVMSCENEDDDYILQHPCFIAEVMSKSTRRIDLGEKVAAYQRIPSMQCYVAIDIEPLKALVWNKINNAWLQTWVLDVDTIIDTGCAGITFTLQDILSN
jgi:Uma2 family endonuclease